jgi:hypothetical protein
MRLVHYHLVSSSVRALEARYLGKLGLRLVARYGRIGEERCAYEAGIPWEALDRIGFKARETELEGGGVNVVVQTGQWSHPRLDHLGLVGNEELLAELVRRAERRGLATQSLAGGRRTSIATGAGLRLEYALGDEEGEAPALTELHLRTDAPGPRAKALASLLGTKADGTQLEVGGTLVRFIEGGPRGRPELWAERFVAAER